MVYFCADDYGLSYNGNSRIENCLKNGVLNKISVLPNGELANFKQSFLRSDAVLSLHINLIEGYPLSNPEDVDLLITDDGCFKYSFLGLLLLSFSSKRKKLKKQLYNEIQKQVRFWKDCVGEDKPLSIDSHQHTHMIPLVFKTLMRVIKDEKLNVGNVRVPSEPILPYIFSPSLYFSYSPVGLLKQWLLKFLAFINRKEIKLPYAYFMGVMFSGKVTERKIEKLLPHYMKLAEKNGKDIEIGFHPGYFENDEDIIRGSKKSFDKFYFSRWRKKEYDTLMNLKF